VDRWRARHTQLTCSRACESRSVRCSAPARAFASHRGGCDRECESWLVKLPATVGPIVLSLTYLLLFRLRQDTRSNRHLHPLGFSAQNASVALVSPLPTLPRGRPPDTRPSLSTRMPWRMHAVAPARVRHARRGFFTRPPAAPGISQGLQQRDLAPQSRCGALSLCLCLCHPSTPARCSPLAAADAPHAQSRARAMEEARRAIHELALSPVTLRALRVRRRLRIAGDARRSLRPFFRGPGLRHAKVVRRRQRRATKLERLLPTCARSSRHKVDDDATSRERRRRRRSSRQGDLLTASASTLSAIRLNECPRDLSIKSLTIRPIKPHSSC